MPDMLTADGHIIALRPVQPDDAESLLALYHDTGEDSRHLRFFSFGRAPIDREVKRLTRTSAPDHHAVAAWDGTRAIGVASYERLADPTQAEFAVLVADDWHGRGVGTLLIEELAAHARNHGVGELLGDVLAVNTGMLRLATNIAPHAAIDRGSDVDVVHVTTDFDDAALEALFT